MLGAACTATNRESCKGKCSSEASSQQIISHLQRKPQRIVNKLKKFMARGQILFELQRFAFPGRGSQPKKKHRTLRRNHGQSQTQTGRNEAQRAQHPLRLSHRHKQHNAIHTFTFLQRLSSETATIDFRDKISCVPMCGYCVKKYNKKIVGVDIFPGADVGTQRVAEQESQRKNRPDDAQLATSCPSAYMGPTSQFFLHPVSDSPSFFSTHMTWPKHARRRIAKLWKRWKFAEVLLLQMPKVAQTLGSGYLAKTETWRVLQIQACSVSWRHTRQGHARSREMTLERFGLIE